MLKRIKSDDAFMGATHSISSIALYLLFLALAPQIFVKMFGTESILLILVSIFILYGASRLPDLDNTKSSAISALGPFGEVLSEVMRSLSVMVFHISKTKYDGKDANPHRGFFHTAVSGILLFFLVLSTTSIKGEIQGVPTSQIFAMIWVFICSKIAFSAILSKTLKKYKKKSKLLAGGINTILSFFISILIIILTRNSTPNYQWLAFVIAFGYISHIIGDTMTVSGAPILFPIPIKGKRWFNVRIARFEAGGEIEKIILIPTFLIISILSMIRIFTYIT